jgi:YD repeat-containing protein
MTRVENSISKYEYGEYDVLGRVKTGTQTTVTQSPATESYQMSYEYDLAGDMTSQTYPSGRKVTTTYDSAARITEVKGELSGQMTPYASSFSYASHGAVKEMKLGNGLWESAQFNNRLQPVMMGLGASQGASGVWRLDYTYETTPGAMNNNGNVLSQKITVPTGGSPLVLFQSYLYDGVNRLLEARENLDSDSGTQQWKQRL